MCIVIIIIIIVIVITSLPATVNNSWLSYQLSTTSQQNLGHWYNKEEEDDLREVHSEMVVIA
jgi:flagellar basal body-associated protein FliL